MFVMKIIFLPVMINLLKIKSNTAIILVVKV